MSKSDRWTPELNASFGPMDDVEQILAINIRDTRIKEGMLISELAEECEFPIQELLRMEAIADGHFTSALLPPHDVVMTIMGCIGLAVDRALPLLSNTQRHRLNVVEIDSFETTPDSAAFYQNLLRLRLTALEALCDPVREKTEAEKAFFVRIREKLGITLGS